MERAGRLFGKLHLPPEMADPGARVRGAWTRAVGKNVAKHTTVVALVRDKLVVEVEDRVWQKYLVGLQHFIIRNLAKEMGEHIVKDLDLRPMPPRIRAQRAEASRPTPAGTDEASAIEDPVLQMLYRKSAGKELGKAKKESA
jgi:hypothetical protein